MMKLTGGFGTVDRLRARLGQSGDDAPSWDLIARYVVPEVNGMLDSRASRSAT